MFKRLILLFIFMLLPSFLVARGSGVGPGLIQVKEDDGSPDQWVTTIIVNNDSLSITDNEATINLTVSGMATATWDGDSDGFIDADAGGTDVDNSSANGVPQWDGSGGYDINPTDSRPLTFMGGDTYWYVDGNCSGGGTQYDATTDPTHEENWTCTGGSGRVFETLQGAVDALPQIMYSRIIIKVNGETFAAYNEDIELHGLDCRAVLTSGGNPAHTNGSEYCVIFNGDADNDDTLAKVDSFYIGNATGMAAVAINNFSVLHDTPADNNNAAIEYHNANGKIEDISAQSAFTDGTNLLLVYGDSNVKVAGTMTLTDVANDVEYAMHVKRGGHIAASGATFTGVAGTGFVKFEAGGTIVFDSTNFSSFTYQSNLEDHTTGQNGLLFDVGTNALILAGTLNGMQILAQADCSGITAGICLDTDDGKFYSWDGDSVELTGVLDWQPLEATLTDIADGTLVEDINLPADIIDAITEIAAALKSGDDTTLITGTAGSDTHCAQWNADGDLVSSGAGCGGGSGAFSDAGDPVVLNTTTKDTQLGAAQINSAKFSVDGDADQVQLAVQGHSTQTNNLAEFENNGGTVVASVDNTGKGTFAGGVDAGSSADPAVTWKDSDGLGADEESSKALSNMSTVTDGAEVSDFRHTFLDAGTRRTFDMWDGSAWQYFLGVCSDDWACSDVAGYESLKFDFDTGTDAEVEVTSPSGATILNFNIANTRIQGNYVYRATGTDVPDADVADDITITNIAQVQDITATAAEINTIDDCATTELFVGGGAGSAPICTTATGTGAPVRAGDPAFTGFPTTPAAAPDADYEVANKKYVDELVPATATALAANGGNCSAGEYPLGVDQSGAVENCTDATTEIDSAISTHAGAGDPHAGYMLESNIGTGASNYVQLSGSPGTPDGTKFLRDDMTWVTPAGGGDVTGPGSSTDNAIPRFDSTGGKTLQNSGVIIDDSNNVTGVASMTITLSTPGLTGQDSDDASGTYEFAFQSSGGDNPIDVTFDVEESSGSNAEYLSLDGSQKRAKFSVPVYGAFPTTISTAATITHATSDVLGKLFINGDNDPQDHILPDIGSLASLTDGSYSICFDTGRYGTNVAIIPSGTDEIFLRSAATAYSAGSAIEASAAGEIICLWSKGTTWYTSENTSGWAVQ